MRARLLQHGATRTAMSRGHLILDENVAYLQEPLQRRNFKVTTVPVALADYRIIEDYLSGRKFITKNSKDFKYHVSEAEFVLINADTVTSDPEELANIISRAWIDMKINTLHGGVIVHLNANGKHKLEEVD